MSYSHVDLDNANNPDGDINSDPLEASMMTDDEDEIELTNGMAVE